MRFRSWLMIPALVGVLAAGPAPTGAPVDPLEAPTELTVWARQVTLLPTTTRGKVQAILNASFRPVEDHGLGIVYDNRRTRTVTEVWEEKKANCLGLTSFLVAACKAIGIHARFAEPTNLNHWRRDGQLIRIERHVVAFVPNPPMEDIVADFLPQLRQTGRIYVVDILGEARIRALFHSNRAVELMEAGELNLALDNGRIAVESDPTCATAWNIQGVVQRALKLEVPAESSYRKAHALAPKDGAAIGNLEQQMRDLGRLDEAAQFRILSLETRKKDPFFNAFLAEEASREGRLDAALDLIRTAIRLSPHNPELYLTEAQIALEQGRPDEAKKSLENARRWALPRERERYDTKLALLAKR